MSREPKGAPLLVRSVIVHKKPQRTKKAQSIFVPAP
jgi:hypothetical protein